MKNTTRNLTIIFLALALLSLIIGIYIYKNKDEKDLQEVLFEYYTYGSEDYEKINDLYSSESLSAGELVKIKSLFTEDGWKEFSTGGRFSIGQYWMLIRETGGKTSAEDIELSESEKTTNAKGSSVQKIPWSAKVTWTNEEGTKQYHCTGAFFLDTEGKIVTVDFFTDDGLWDDCKAWCREKVLL